MAITPRCWTAASATATVSPALTGWTNAGQGVTGTAPVAGDFVVIVSADNAQAATASQTAGTGTWTFQTTGTANSLGMATFVAWRIFTGVETAPTFTWSSGGRSAYTIIAVTPDSLNTVSIDAWSTVLVDTTAALTHTPNSAAASGTDLSLILSGFEAGTSGTTAITETPATSWTATQVGSNAGGASTKSYATTIDFRGSVTGTVAPGSESTNVTTAATVYQVLLTQAFTRQLFTPHRMPQGV